MRKNLKIAGAGPAGLTAAICLAKAGHTVDLFEAKETVGARFIGDFQIIENGSQEKNALALLNEIGIDVNFFIQPVKQAVFFDASLSPHPIESRSPFAYFIRRGDVPNTLDEGLRQQALSAGVNIHYKSRLKPEEADIVATGPSTSDGLAKQKTFLTALPDTVWVIFDSAIAPGGYAYLFVINGEATLGCAITSQANKVNYFFDRAVERFQVLSPFTMENERAGYAFMNFDLKKSAMIGRRLLVGEAGGFQDYLFGLGIRYAIITGHLAARSVMESVNYDTLWQEAIGAMQKTSLVNRALYEWGGRGGLLLFMRQASRSDFRSYLLNWHQDRMWKRLLLPIVKWLWARNGSCAHFQTPHWCRKKSVLTTNPLLPS